MQNGRSTVGVLWNGGPAVNLNEATGTIGDHVASIVPSTPKPGVFAETVALEYCALPRASRGGYFFSYPLTLQASTLGGGTLTSLTHRSEAHVYTSAGRQAVVSLKSSSSVGPSLRVSWFKTRAPVGLLIDR